jgi:hypothetical protein
MRRFLALLAALVCFAAPPALAQSVAVRTAVLQRGPCADGALRLNPAAGVYCQTGTSFARPDQIPGWSYTRTGTETAPDASGVLQTFAANVPAITNLGMQVWEARTNVLLQSVMTSNGSSLPPGMSFQAASGLTQSVVGAGQEYGMGYIDWSITGTAVGSVYPSLYLTGAGASGPAASNGQVWSASVYMRVASGVLPAGGMVVGAQIFNGGSYLGSLGTSPANTASGLTRVAVVGGTIANASTTNIAQYLGNASAIPNGTVVNVVIRVYAPQLEQASTPGPYIPTTTAAATRGAATASTPLTLPAGDWTLFLQVNLPVVTSSYQGLVAIDDGTLANQIYLFKTTGNNRARGGVDIASATTFDTAASPSVLPVLSAGVSKMAIVYQGGVMTVQANGVSYPATAVTLPSGLNRLNVGRFNGSGGFTANAGIQQIALLRYAAFGLTTP